MHVSHFTGHSIKLKSVTTCRFPTLIEVRVIAIPILKSMSDNFSHFKHEFKLDVSMMEFTTFTCQLYTPSYTLSYRLNGNIPWRSVPWKWLNCNEWNTLYFGTRKNFSLEQDTFYYAFHKYSNSCWNFLFILQGVSVMNN